jgi:2-polyprenyl-3-methyl-5-hydroxy-6-metoxy-1,4-benzoquinol methylase
LEFVEGPRVLDVGCTDHVVHLGQGAWLHGRLRQAFDQVAGIDISRSGLDEMREAGFDNLHCASAETFDLGEQFDTVVAGELIEHLANPGAFLERALAHLRPGGRIVLSTPYPFSVSYSLYALRNYPRTCENEEHVMWFCPRTLSALAERCGLLVHHFELAEDYDFDSPSGSYRRLVRFLRTARPVLPERLRGNTMIFVLGPAGG